MARHRRTIPTEDLFHIASRLPWWGSVLIAAGVWFAFQPIAISQPTTITNTHEFSVLVAGQVFRAFVQFGQFLLPLIFLFGAVTFVIGRIRRRRLLEGVANAAQPGKALDEISWQRFEQLAGETFRRQGFTVQETGSNGPDGGIDLILSKGSENTSSNASNGAP